MYKCRIDKRIAWNCINSHKHASFPAAPLIFTLHGTSAAELQGTEAVQHDFTVMAAGHQPGRSEWLRLRRDIFKGTPGVWLISTSLYMYIYIYKYIIHTHTYLCRYIYIYICSYANIKVVIGCLAWFLSQEWLFAQDFSQENHARFSAAKETSLQDMDQGQLDHFSK